MEPNPRRGKTLSTQIPIYSLSGGVGRQAPSKRLPNEAEQMINALCTVERSIEKRPGTDLMPVKGGNNDYTAEKLGVENAGTLEFFWHSLSDTLRFLIAIDRDATNPGDTLFYVWYYDQANECFVDQNVSSAVPDEVRAYITYGSDELKLVTRGQNLLFLNPGVKAGYTSKLKTFTAADNAAGITLDTADPPGTAVTDGQTAWCQIGLDGQFKVDDPNNPTTYYEDVAGGEVDYLTAVKVDPAQIATFYNKYSPYVIGTQVLVVPGVAEAITLGAGAGGNGIVANGDGSNDDYYILQAKQSVPPNHDISDIAYWTVIATDKDPFDPTVGGTVPDAPPLDEDRTPKRISVKDWQYPDSTQLQLGQSLPTFNNLTIPPLQVDVTDGNNGAEAMLSALYGLDTNTAADLPLTNSADGKVYYVQAGYQGQSPGYYLAKSVASPSFQAVRTPDAYSVIDKNRMPMQLEFSVDSWEWSTVEWQERTSGDRDNNPGPSPFKDGKQVNITTMASFRNRLWMAVGDVLFSSRMDTWTNLWIDDPGVIVDTDPIDVAASTNRYTPVTAMVPFKEYMFVNTNADVQYELMGSENQITPFTAELQPMTFYSTAPLVDPLTLGNYIFFFDAERLYLYMGRGGTLSTAQELSAHCPKYLPSNFGSTSVAAAQDTILVVDKDSTSDVYVYTTKYRGNEIAQNAIYQFSYDEADIRSMQSWDNDNYMVVARGDDFFIERQHMRFQDTDIPLLDRKQKIPLTFGTLSTDRTSDNAEYNPADFTTTIRLPFLLESGKSYQLVDSDGVGYVGNNTTADVSSGLYTDITLQGDIRLQPFIWIGEKFTMQIQLSTQFVRDERNNAQEGVLNLASLRTSHFETGNYDVITQRRGRPMADIVAAYESRNYSLLNYTTTFAAPRADVAVGESNLPLLNTEYQGELVSKIMGYSDKVDIFILSDYFTPVNITNMELKGKFTQKYSSVL
jgi:hypothetical protein